MKDHKCHDCEQPIKSNEKFCDRCLAQWYIENEVDDNTPSGDFEEDRREF